MDNRRPNSNAASKAARRRKRRRRKVLQTVIPVLIALVLIVIVAVVGVKTGLFESFTESSNKADLNSYFQVMGDNQATVIADGEMTEERIPVKDGKCYLPLETIKSDYNDRFYYDESGNAILYTNGEGTTTIPFDSSSYTVNETPQNTDYTICFIGDEAKPYMALDFVKNYANFDYTLFGGDNTPYRLQIKREWGQKACVKLESDEASLRIAADKKSDILKELKQGDELTVVSGENEKWMKVSTEDLFTGYVEKKHIGEVYEVAETPVTSYVEETIPTVADGSQIVLAWHNITVEGGSSFLDDYSSRLSDMNVISPTWFALADDEGTVASIADADYVSKAHAAGVKVWGLVDNMTYPEVTTYNILSDTAKRRNVIAQLLSLASQYSLDGINVDFESLPTECGEPFIQFIRELTVEAHKAGLVISVDNYVPKGYNEHYHRKEQGVFADYVIIMGYDEHTTGSDEPGSVASIGFVKDGIDQTLLEVPNGKIINAVPFYTRLWIESGADASYSLDVQTLPMQQALDTVSQAGVTAAWDEETGQNYAEWGDTTKYRTWLEDKQSLSEKLSVMKASDIAGVAIWQLAYSTESAWEAIREYYPVNGQ